MADNVTLTQTWEHRRFVVRGEYQSIRIEGVGVTEAGALDEAKRQLIEIREKAKAAPVEIVVDVDAL